MLTNKLKIREHFVTTCINYDHWSTDCFKSNQTDKALQISKSPRSHSTPSALHLNLRQEFSVEHPSYRL